YKRVKLLHFTDEELPRTATRKVKRSGALKMLQKIEDSARASQATLARDETTADAAWLVDIISSVSNRSRDEISINARLADLGFDSLMFVELATAIENAGGYLTAPERLNEVQDVRELLTVVNREASQTPRREGARLRLAPDYFFDTKYKRAYMENFTNLVPMERTGSLRQSLRHARSFLDRGYNALIFPEGTRSMTGKMADFKPVIGYLALASRVGILPVYLEGTHEAFPKGSTVLKSRNVGARIG